MKKPILIMLGVLLSVSSAFSYTSSPPESPKTRSHECAGWTTKLIGTYNGFIGYQDSERKDPVLNEIIMKRDCTLFGRYDFKEPSGEVHGVFMPIEPVDENTLLITWHDKYGSGKLKVTFSGDKESFEGSWGSNQSASSGGTWTGKKERSPNP